MAEKDIVAAVDQAIAALKAARKALASGRKGAKPGPKPGLRREPAKGTRGKRVLSEDSRQRIVEAQRKRWAAVHKAAKKAARKTA